jgi:hypothetical protein
MNPIVISTSSGAGSFILTIFSAIYLAALGNLNQRVDPIQT